MESLFLRYLSSGAAAAAAALLLLPLSSANAQGFTLRFRNADFEMTPD